MYRDACFGYEIKEWNGRPVMVWEKYLFYISDASHTAVCNYVAYVMSHIVSRLEDMGYVKEVVPLSYDTWGKIDPIKMYLPVVIKGVHTEFVDVGVELSIEPVCSLTYKDGVHLLCEAKLKLFLTVE